MLKQEKSFMELLCQFAGDDLAKLPWTEVGLIWVTGRCPVVSISSFSHIYSLRVTYRFGDGIQHDP